MKNHWLQLYEKKKQRSWTAEFIRNSSTMLRPRRVFISDEDVLGSAGQVELIFQNSFIYQSDNELLDLFNEARHSMVNWHCYLRLYTGLTEIQHYELRDLMYVYTGGASSIQDTKFIFHFSRVKFIK